ncbi:hypothetical protein EDD22DRAFT_967612 [Suillus occidentalis]|nr:hypothetical protein EDD22DRAFT_967612 [Suillus occidentalis]
MTFVSNDPSLWPYIDAHVFYSYWLVVAGVVVAYDWALTIGQEIELIWRQRWSLMTVLYLVIRYIGIPYSFVIVLNSTPNVSLTDALIGYTPEAGILSGIHMCGYSYEGNFELLASMVWMLNTVWEVLALCLSVWIAVKHFRDLRRLGPSTGSTIGDCFRVLMKSHVLYFASFAGVSCFQLIYLSPGVLYSLSIGSTIYAGIRTVLLAVQMFVLGPRLILSVREYHAELVAGSDADTSMNSIVFQEHVHISTSGTV